MSFSKDIKNEILSKSINEDCCGLAFLSGLFSASGNIDIGENLTFTLYTDIESLPSFINKIVKNLYGKEITYTKSDNYLIKKGDYFKITIDGEFAYSILKDTGLICIKDGRVCKDLAVNEYMIKEEHCLKNFVAGVFVGAGTSSIKINKDDRLSTGYHLEFASKNYEFLCGLEKILSQFEIYAKLITRKKLYILYVKDAGEVSNVLALIGAYNSVLALQNEMAIREVRNKVNRQTNCMNANINKTVIASMKQNDAISYLVENTNLEDLPQDLQNVALLRMANPEESLEELIKLATFKITKSGLNYRLNKLIKLAEKLKEKGK